jgi:hypothetical protein
VTPQAKAGVEQALLAVMRARHPDRVWSLVPGGDGEGDEFRVPATGQVGRSLTSPEDADSFVEGGAAGPGGAADDDGVDRGGEESASLRRRRVGPESRYVLNRERQSRPSSVV